MLIPLRLIIFKHLAITVALVDCRRTPLACIGHGLLAIHVTLVKGWLHYLSDATLVSRLAVIGSSEA